MKIFRFNTNIKDKESLPQLSGTLNKDRRIISFKVDMQQAEHIMEVTCNENITEQEVRDMISIAGFQTSPIHTEIPGSAQQL